MKRTVRTIAALVVATGVGAVILSTSPATLAHGPQAGDPRWMGQGYDPDMMGQGYGGCPYLGMGSGMMMGHGMMGRGITLQGMERGMMGPGMMGPSMMGPQGTGPMPPLREDLSANDVRHMMGHWLAWQGNPNLKLGMVEEKDDDTVVAEVVTKEGSLVQRFEIDRHTGWMQQAQ